MAKNLFKLYEVDTKRESEGVEISVDGAVFICRRAGGANRAYRAAVAVHSERLSERIESKDEAVALAASDEATLYAFADTVIVGWREVLDRNDQPWEFSKENFIELMKACPDLWAFLHMKARDLDNFRIKETVDAGEQLGKSSFGTENTALILSGTSPSPTPDMPSP